MLRLRWAEEPLGQNRVELASCESTNDELSRLAAAGAEHGTVVRADRQSAGRGRLERAWSSGHEGDLYASILLRPRLRPPEVPALALVAGIAVARAAARFGVAAQLKWPNDVVVGVRKLAGILCETSIAAHRLEHVVVGIGANLSRPRFEPELAKLATSIAIEGGEVPSPTLMLDAILEELVEPLAAFGKSGVPGIADDWTALCRDIGRPVTIHIECRDVSGTMVGITPTGALDMEMPTGERLAVVAGDVTIDYP